MLLLFKYFVIIINFTYCVNRESVHDKFDTVVGLSGVQCYELYSNARSRVKKKHPKKPPKQTKTTTTTTKTKQKNNTSPPKKNNNKKKQQQTNKKKPLSTVTSTFKRYGDNIFIIYNTL